jgi:hypothetical protein
MENTCDLPNLGSSAMALRNKTQLAILCYLGRRGLLTSTKVVSLGSSPISWCNLNRSCSWEARPGIEIPCVRPEWFVAELRMIARTGSPQAIASDSRLITMQAAPSPLPNPEALLSYEKHLPSGDKVLTVMLV